MLAKAGGRGLALRSPPGPGSAGFYVWRRLGPALWSLGWLFQARCADYGSLPFSTASLLAVAGAAWPRALGGRGFSSVLRLVGLGFKCWRVGCFLFLDLGKTHFFRIQIPAGVYTLLRRKRGLIFFGLDAQSVYGLARLVRSCYVPDPYKGKGVRFKDEALRLKPGKQR